jgi:hypothetical protein
MTNETAVAAHHNNGALRPNGKIVGHPIATTNWSSALLEAILEPEKANGGEMI